MKPTHKKEGSVIIAVLITVILMGMIVGACLQSSFVESKLSNRTFQMQAALNLAESGLEEAMLGIIKSDWTDWTMVDSTSYYRDINNISFTDGQIGRVRVYVEDIDTLPILVSEGRITNSFGTVVSKQIRVDLKVDTPYANGLSAKSSVIFNGVGDYADAYDSRSGVYDTTSNRTDEVSVAANKILVNKGNIWGRAVTGGTSPTIQSPGSIGPDGTFSGAIDPDSLATDFEQNFPDAVAPTLSSPITTLSIGTDTTIGSGSYKLERLTMSGADSLTITGDVTIVLDRNLSISDTAKITIESSGSLKLYAAESIIIGGRGVENKTNVPENFELHGTGTTAGSQSLDIKCEAEFTGVVYAPNAEVHVDGGGTHSGVVNGAIVGNNITFSNGVQFHYDQALEDLSDGLYQIQLWRELKSPTQKLNFDSATALAEAVAPM